MIKPDVIVCLGATAATTIVGPGTKIATQRGEFIATDYCPKTIVSWHPSAILRMTDQQRSDEMFNMLVSDLGQAARI
jgi:DNA polymerase